MPTIVPNSASRTHITPNGAEFHLLKKPQAICPVTGLEDVVSVTAGDLHGNFLRLLHFLVLHAVVDCSEKVYEDLATFYYNIQPDQDESTPDDQLTPERYQHFCQLLEQITVYQKPFLVRLIGDDLADRGRNDLYTLLLMRKLRQAGIQQQVLISNHSIEFLIAFERKIHDPASEMSSAHFKDSLDDTQSLVNFQTALTEQIVTWSQAQAILNDDYLPYLRLIDLEVCDATKRLYFYNHAPVDIQVIPMLAYLVGMGPLPLPSDPHELKNQVTAINAAFQAQYVKPHKLHTLAEGPLPDADQSFARLLLIFNDLSQLPDRHSPEGARLCGQIFLTLFWNRVRGFSRTAKIGDYQIHYINGHDFAREGTKQSRNVTATELDTYFGKLSFYRLSDVMCTSLYPSVIRTKTATTLRLLSDAERSLMRVASFSPDQQVNNQEEKDDDVRIFSDVSEDDAEEGVTPPAPEMTAQQTKRLIDFKHQLQHLIGMMLNKSSKKSLKRLIDFDKLQTIQTDLDKINLNDPAAFRAIQKTFAEEVVTAKNLPKLKQRHTVFLTAVLNGIKKLLEAIIGLFTKQQAKPLHQQGFFSYRRSSATLHRAIVGSFTTLRHHPIHRAPVTLCASGGSISPLPQATAQSIPDGHVIRFAMTK